MTRPELSTPLRGPALALRLIAPEDAAYVHGLRVDPHYNRHLSEVRGTVDDQRRWIEAYKAREAAGTEFYFIIQRHDGTPCGTVRLYGIDGDRFTWGSWILDHNKPSKAALESAVLSFGFAFEGLDCTHAHVDVKVGNARAEAFYRRLGMTETHADAQDIFFTYPRARFMTDRAAHLAILTGGTTA